MNFLKQHYPKIAVLAVVLGFLGFIQIRSAPPVEAQATSAVPFSVPAGVKNGCSGQGTLSSGTLQLTADCLRGYTAVGVAIQPSAAVTPGSVSVNIAAATAATQYPTASVPTATHTVVIINASTANATPVVNWWGIN